MYSKHHSPLISTLDQVSFTNAGLSTDSVTTEDSLYIHPMTTSVANTTTQESTSMNVKQMQLYKTEYCRNWAELGECRYGKKCRYAHGDAELRKLPRHSRYKTQICRTYHLKGACHYGNRCTFIHDFQEMKKMADGGNDSLVGFTLDDGCENNHVGQDKLVSGNLRQHSRFFATKNVSKDQEVPWLHSTPATAKSINGRNDGVWHSKLGLGSPQPPGYATNLVPHQGLTSSALLTTTPSNTTMAENGHQKYGSSLRSHSLPAYNSGSVNQNTHLLGTNASPSLGCYYQHGLNTSTPTLDAAIFDHLTSLQMGDGYRGSYSSSLKPTSFYIT